MSSEWHVISSWSNSVSIYSAIKSNGLWSRVNTINSANKCQFLEELQSEWCHLVSTLEDIGTGLQLVTRKRQRATLYVPAQTTSLLFHWDISHDCCHCGNNNIISYWTNALPMTSDQNILIQVFTRKWADSTALSWIAMLHADCWLYLRNFYAFAGSQHVFNLFTRWNHHLWFKRWGGVWGDRIGIGSSKLGNRVPTAGLGKLRLAGHMRPTGFICLLCSPVSPRAFLCSE